MGKVDRNLLFRPWLCWRVLGTKDTIVRSEDVNDDLSVSAPVPSVVEDEDGGKLDLGKVFTL